MAPVADGSWEAAAFSEATSPAAPSAPWGGPAPSPQAARRLAVEAAAAMERARWIGRMLGGSLGSSGDPCSTRQSVPRFAGAAERWSAHLLVKRRMWPEHGRLTTG